MGAAHVQDSTGPFSTTGRARSTRTASWTCRQRSTKRTPPTISARAEQAEVELDALVQQLSEAFGITGRALVRLERGAGPHGRDLPRPSGDTADRRRPSRAGTAPRQRRTDGHVVFVRTQRPWPGQCNDPDPHDVRHTSRPTERKQSQDSPGGSDVSHRSTRKPVHGRPTPSPSTTSPSTRSCATDRAFSNMLPG